ncbi:MAG: Imm49 family immunity protein [Bacillota bacterium]
MNGLAETEFHARIEYERRFASNTIKRSDAAQRPDLTRLTLAANGWGRAGMYSAHLGRFKEAGDAFLLSAVYRLQQCAVADADIVYPFEMVQMMEMAVLSGDSGVAVKAAEESLSAQYTLEARLKKAYFDALRMLVLGKAEAARVAADELRAIPGHEAVRAKCYPGLGEAVAAIIDRDNAAFRDALETILERHLRCTRGSLRGTPEALFSRPATCLAILGHRMGLKVRVDERFHTVRILFNTVSLKEWRGQPVYHQYFETVADLLPMSFVK